MKVIPKLVSDGMNRELIKEVCEEEMMQAAFELGAMKALGPDGFNGAFYQRYWGIVREGVVKAVRGFLNGGYMLKELNRMNLVLIPKVKST